MNAFFEWDYDDFKREGYLLERFSGSSGHESDVGLKNCPCRKCQHELDRRPNWYLDTQELKEYYGQESEEEP